MTLIICFVFLVALLSANPIVALNHSLMEAMLDQASQLQEDYGSSRLSHKSIIRSKLLFPVFDQSLYIAILHQQVKGNIAHLDKLDLQIKQINMARKKTFEMVVSIMGNSNETLIKELIKKLVTFQKQNQARITERNEAMSRLNVLTNKIFQTTKVQLKYEQMKKVVRAKVDQYNKLKMHFKSVARIAKRSGKTSLMQIMLFFIPINFVSVDHVEANRAIDTTLGPAENGNVAPNIVDSQLMGLHKQAAAQRQLLLWISLPAIVMFALFVAICATVAFWNN